MASSEQRPGYFIRGYSGFTQRSGEKPTFIHEVHVVHGIPDLSFASYGIPAKSQPEYREYALERQSSGILITRYSPHSSTRWLRSPNPFQTPTTPVFDRVFDELAGQYHDASTAYDLANAQAFRHTAQRLGMQWPYFNQDLVEAFNELPDELFETVTPYIIDPPPPPLVRVEGLDEVFESVPINEPTKPLA